MKVLVLGGSGLFGRYLAAELKRAGHEVLSPGHSALDLLDASAVAAFLELHRPEWTVNCAGISKMEQCAADPVGTRRLNVEAPAFLAGTCAGLGLRFAHLSSDYVFAGEVRRPLKESDPAVPLSEYGRQKLAGEEAVLGHAGHLVVRVAWLFGAEGTTFMSLMPDLLMKRDRLEVAALRTGSCLYCGTGASLFRELIEKGMEGLVHLVHEGEVTWEDFAMVCLERLRQRGLNPACQRIEQVSAGQVGALSEPRPPYSVLDTGRLATFLGKRPPGWTEGLDAFLSELQSRELPPKPE
jgi:dTDP-4-dehydrorhamnose reductase